MEQTAVPGTVQVSKGTYNLVAPLFEFEDLGYIEVKGKSERVKTYRPLRRKADPGRLRGIIGLEPHLIGRGQEKDLLEKAFKNLRNGIGGIVYLIGEAGLGKSRLIREFKSSSLDQHTRVSWFETHSLSYEAKQPYGLFGRLMRRVIQAGPEDEPESIREKILAALKGVPELETDRTQRVFESLFGLPGPQGTTPLEGETFKGLLYTEMAGWWERQARVDPVVLVCDDVHWSDPASVALLQHLFPLTNSAPLLLVCALRPEQDTAAYHAMQYAKRDFPNSYQEVELRPLNVHESGELVDSLLHISDLPGGLRNRILEKSEGNPYFVEEVVRTLIDRGVITQDEDGAHWQATGEGADLDIPDNLQTLLIARIDRLAEEARRTLQLASVVGRSFYYRLLQRLVDFAVEELDHNLLSLQSAQMIQEATRVPELEYLFRHALTQEAAYSTILLKQRRTFHLAVGEAMETLFSDQLDELSSQLALHYSQGRQAEKALAYYTRAGDHAFRLFAMAEALTHYEEALEWTGRGQSNNQQLIHLYLRRGRTLELLLRFDEALAVYQELESLGEESGEETLRQAAIAVQAAFYVVGKVEWDRASKLAEKALALARHLGDRAAEARSLWILLISTSWVNPEQAIEYGEQGLVIARELASQPTASQKDFETLALLLIDSVSPLGPSGDMKVAQERAIEGGQMSEKLGNLPMVTTAATNISWVYATEGRLQEAREELEKVVAINQSIGNEGGELSAYNNLLFHLPALGDFAGFYSVLETAKPIASREGKGPSEVYDLYPVVAHYWLGAIAQVWNNLDRLVDFQGKFPIFPQIFLSYAALAFIQAGEYLKGAELLEKMGEIEIENYVLEIAPNVTQAKAELALAAGEHRPALAILEPFLQNARQKRLLRWLPQKLLLKGRILEGAGRPDKAYPVLQEAHALAAKQQARVVLWQICMQLAEMETVRGNPAAAQALVEEAQTSIAYIADHAGGDELRESFLAMPRVQSVLPR
jgi:tetratricopeptide (TPR) repeat protein